jgi:hypothetical protein
LQGVLGEREHLLRVEGLHDVVERAVFHRLDGGLRRAEGGHQDDQLLRVGGADVLERLDAAHAAHADVEEDEIGRRPFLHARHASSPLAASVTCTAATRARGRASSGSRRRRR